MSHTNIKGCGKMKNKIKLMLLIIIILFILSTSTIQAETIKTHNKNETENIIAEKTEADEEPNCIGLIHGSVGNSHGVYSWTPYPFALVTAGIKRTRCNIIGDYSMSLLLYREYYVTAHVIGFKPLTKYVYLTLKDPIQTITFDMDESEPVNIEPKSISRPISFGFVFGITGGVYDYASWPVGFTTLEFGNRKKISGYFGFYTIGFLRIGETYSITASKEDYIPLTLEVTLTAEKPIQWINFWMWPDM